MTEKLRETYDVVVAGGGAAGLSAALMLARSRRSVMVIDGGQPRNAPAAGVHGFLSRDGIPPADLLDIGRREVASYGGQIITGEIDTIVRVHDAFAVTLSGGQTVGARRLLVATGVVDELPDVPGLRDRWGKDVLHCPYCHGFEVRDRAIGVLAGGPLSLHRALLFRQLSEDITFFTHGTTLSPEEAEQLAARGIRVVDAHVAALDIVDDRLVGVRVADGTLVPCDALAVAPRMAPRSDFLADLGVLPAEHPSGAGTYIPSDATGRSVAPGVWVAGNVTDLSAQVGAAAASGAAAAAQINADLVTEETRRAVLAYRDKCVAPAKV